jgi:ubiquitin-like protein Nedd8
MQVGPNETISSVLLSFLCLTFFSFYSFHQIFVKTLTGRKQAFNFEPSNQVLAVKQALQEKEGILVDQIRLIYSGRQLYVFTRVVSDL